MVLNMMARRLKTGARTAVAVLAAVIALACLLSLTATQANAAADTPCDPQFMQALESRAWLEAQREITQNQNLIAKPDSVLEYSCFIGFLNKAASNFNIGTMRRQFSETDVWDTDGFDDESTDRALTAVVSSALATYIDSNFPHTFIGGRLGLPAKPNGDDMSTVDGGQDYECETMAKVWEAARCLNFGARADEDGFHDFFFMRDNDPRNLPDELAACNAPVGPYNTALKEAFNNRQAMFVLPTAADTAADGTPYAIDNVLSYFNLIMPGACAAPIPTGVIIRRNGRDVNDAVCPNPGCTYNGATCN